MQTGFDLKLPPTPGEKGAATARVAEIHGSHKQIDGPAM